MISSVGLSSSARTISMRCRSPTDRVETVRCGSSFSPYCAITSRILRLEFARRDLRIDARARCSRAPSSRRTARSAGTPCRCRASAPPWGWRRVIGFAVPADLAGIGLHDAVDHLDERGLARAVLAEQRVDFARLAPKTTLSLASTPGKRLVMPVSCNGAETASRPTTAPDFCPVTGRASTSELPAANVDHNFRRRQRRNHLRPLVPNPVRERLSADRQHQPFERRCGIAFARDTSCETAPAWSSSRPCRHRAHRRAAALPRRSGNRARGRASG